MKLLILSDIHSNICALDAILKNEKNIDAIYAAGDLTDCGPFPHEVISRFKEYDIKTVFGNHDKRILGIWKEYDGNFSNIKGAERWWAHYDCQKMQVSDIEYLNSLPETLDFIADGYYYRISHQYDEGYGRPQCISQFEDFIAKNPVNTNLPIRLIFGHSHRQAICQFRGERLFLNPGSVSYRREDDNDKTAHYAIIENGIITLKAVEYDRSALLNEILSLAINNDLREADLRVAFFFFGSAENGEIPVNESIKRELT